MSFTLRLAACFGALGAAWAIERKALLRKTDISLPTDLDAQGWDQWVFCADQFMQCQCPGAVRWGSPGRWKMLGQQEGPVTCRVDDLGDPDPGNPAKHCECAVSRASQVWFQLSPAVIPEGDTSKPIISCPLLASDRQRESPWGKKLWEAAANFCGSEFADKTVDLPKAGPSSLSSSDLQGLLDTWLDPRFERNYRKFYNADGWTERAFVNYVGNSAPDGRYDRMMLNLIKSVHEFSEAPIVVVHFGMLAPPSWDPDTFPRLVLLHARPLPKDGMQRFRSFNFNKYRAMLIARARVGVQLDSDEFVAPGVDKMFARTAEEVTEDYPMPILPLHFLVDKGPHDGGVWWPRFCKNQDDCPLQTMRWGHAHPTWSFYALPWLGKWLRRNMRDEVLPAREGYKDSELRVMMVPEDEDLLNVGLWEDGGTKQWCKFETPGPEDFRALLKNRTGMHVGGDKRFYPDGAPLVFYTAHHTVDPELSAGIIASLVDEREAGTLPPPISYQGKFFHNGAELRDEFPKLPCLI